MDTMGVSELLISCTNILVSLIHDSVSLRSISRLMSVITIVVNVFSATSSTRAWICSTLRPEQPSPISLRHSPPEGISIMLLAISGAHSCRRSICVSTLTPNISNALSLAIKTYPRLSTRITPELI